MTEILKTRRLTLRTFRSADIQPVTDYVGNWNVCSKLSRVPFPYTRQMAAQWIAGHAASPDIICAIDFEGTFAGCIAQERDFGYWLGEPFWGKGIMTEAARAFVSYLFDEKGMHDLQAGFFKDNPASGIVLAKCGFRQTGENKLFCLARNEEVDHIAVATNRHIWEEVRKNW